MPLNPPAATRPAWPRLGRRRGAYPPTGAPRPFEIPICWLTQPVTLRLEQPFTTAAISRDDGTTARDASAANRLEYGDFPFAAELHTATTTDAANLAHWTITHRSTPRMRSPQLSINLLFRTDTEKVALLRIPRWSRITITGVPPEFPEGASSLVVAGMKHEIGIGVRMLRIVTAPVIGTTPGVPGPWFRYGSSSWGGADLIPF